MSTGPKVWAGTTASMERWEQLIVNAGSLREAIVQLTLYGYRVSRHDFHKHFHRTKEPSRLAVACTTGVWIETIRGIEQSFQQLKLEEERRETYDGGLQIIFGPPPWANRIPSHLRTGP